MTDSFVGTNGLSCPENTGRTATNDPPALAVEGLTVEFLTDRGWVDVVTDLSFRVAQGETLGLVGESGSGKSVTSMAVMGLVQNPPGRVTAGKVLLNGEDLLQVGRQRLEDIRGNEISMVFQEPMSSLNPAYTVGEQIAETVRRHRGASRRAANAYAVDMLDRVGIPDAVGRAKCYPHEFSGGMRQRVMIAIALSCSPSVLIADEPTTSLDVTVQAQILDLLSDLQSEIGMGIVFITHDLGVVRHVCDRVVVMYAGQIVEEAPSAELFDRVSHPYTEALLMSMPEVAARSGSLHVIPGEPPTAGSFAAGCRFHPRCTYATAQCSGGPSGVVEWTEVVPRHVARCRRLDALSLGGDLR